MALMCFIEPIRSPFAAKIRYQLRRRFGNATYTRRTPVEWANTIQIIQQNH